MNKHKKINLCIFGTRSFYDNEKAREINEQEVGEIKPEKIVTAGDADGVCRIAYDVAKKYAIKLELHFLDQEKYGRAKYHYRSVGALKSSNYILFIHNGISKGTRNEIEIAEKMGKRYKYIKIEDEVVLKVEQIELSTKEVKI